MLCIRAIRCENVGKADVCKQEGGRKGRKVRKEEFNQSGSVCGQACRVLERCTAVQGDTEPLLI